MRRLTIFATVALVGATAHAGDLTKLRLAQASVPETAPAPQATPAPQAAPTAQAAPDAAAPTAQSSKQTRKKQTAKRRETDEEKARRIAAKYGISW